MFGVGFWELSFILLLGLLVLGPERLPRAIRTVGFYWRKMRTLAISAQQQIERELDAEDLRRYVERQTQLPEESKPAVEKPQQPEHASADADPTGNEPSSGDGQ